MSTLIFKKIRNFLIYSGNIGTCRLKRVCFAVFDVVFGKKTEYLNVFGRNPQFLYNLPIAGIMPIYYNEDENKNQYLYDFAVAHI